MLVQKFIDYGSILLTICKDHIYYTTIYIKLYSICIYISKYTYFIICIYIFVTLYNRSCNILTNMLRYTSVNLLYDMIYLHHFLSYILDGYKNNYLNM